MLVCVWLLSSCVRRWLLSMSKVSLIMHVTRISCSEFLLYWFNFDWRIPLLLYIHTVLQPSFSEVAKWVLHRRGSATRLSSSKNRLKKVEYSLCRHRSPGVDLVLLSTYTATHHWPRSPPMASALPWYSIAGASSSELGRNIWHIIDASTQCLYMRTRNQWSLRKNRLT
jgi:hypothetical protein